MVKKPRSRSKLALTQVTNPLINQLDFPFMPFLVLALAFVLLLLTLSPYLFTTLKARSEAVVCGGVSNLPCPANL
ncbi:MAG: hypothetical protein WCT01_04790, partial [Candidatus Shapirobacteria bacterium]